MELCVGILVVSTIRCRRYRSADRPCSEGGCCGDKKKMMMMLKWMDYQNQYQLLPLSFSSYPSTTTTITAFMMSDYSYKARICGFLRR
jgi:hypothetical protein